MSTETRHTEKSILYQIMLVINGVQTIEQAASHLKATMEPEDVKLVEKEIANFMASIKKSHL